MKTRKYLTSILSHLDDHRLILLIGARQVGKTTLMRLVEQHCIDKNFETAFLSLDDPNILYALNQHPSELLKLVQTPLGKKCFVFIDEVQYLRDPSGFLKYHVDLSPDIKLIVSGSSAFYIDTRFHDSLAGRKWVHEIFPLDFIEWLDFIGHPEMIPVLPEVLKNRDHHKAPLLTNYLDTYILYGGYPGIALTENVEQKKDLLKTLIQEYAKKDAFEGGILNYDSYFICMKLLAYQIGNLVSKNELANTLNLRTEKIEQYLSVLQRSYHINLVKPFFRNPRKELTKMPKVYFYDTGLRNALVNNFDPLPLRPDRGALIENAVYIQCIHAYGSDAVRFWRTTDGAEVDFVLPDIHRALEVKSSLSLFQIKKYTSFTALYPEIELQGIDFIGSLGL